MTSCSHTHRDVKSVANQIAGMRISSQRGFALLTLLHSVCLVPRRLHTAPGRLSAAVHGCSAFTADALACTSCNCLATFGRGQRHTAPPCSPPHLNATLMAAWQAASSAPKRMAASRCPNISSCMLASACEHSLAITDHPASPQDTGLSRCLTAVNGSAPTHCSAAAAAQVCQSNGLWGLPSTPTLLVPGCACGASTTFHRISHGRSRVISVPPT